MKKLLFVFLSLFILVSCNDGDIITEELDFEDTFNACGGLVFYKIKEDPAESLSLQITSPSLTLAELLTVEDDGNLTYNEEEFDIDGSENFFNYRRYNTTPTDFFCNDVPDSGITITNDEESTTGTAKVYITLVEDDNDGIPAEMEDLNGNGDLTDDDTDGDGLPNYIDEDDDGDNVLTITELNDTDLFDANGDGDNDDDTDDDPLTNIVDTDNDGIPNYLDTDDDNDGVATIDEENISQDEDPSNDFTNANTNAAADYLDDSINTPVAATAYRDHEIQQLFKVTLELINIELPSITYDFLDFGELEDSTLDTFRTVEDIPFP